MRRQCIHSFDDIISLENLLGAWSEFVKGKRSRKDVQEFQQHLMRNIILLHNDLSTKTYTHSLYTAFTISDPKPRNIHKALVRDRLLHHAIYRILYPFFDASFIAHSYSCRNDKGVHKALNAFTCFVRKVSKNNTYTTFVLKCDISKFFASIDHGILKGILRKYIVDRNILCLLDKVIDSFSVEEGKGLPLGNLTSQLLVNIYMNEFDQFVMHKLKAKHYIRYADDFVIFSHEWDTLIEFLSSIKKFLYKELKLDLHPKKVSITTVASGIDYLGWIHFPDHRVIRTATKRRMVRNIQKSCGNSTIKSYLGFLKHGNASRLKNSIVYNEGII